MKSKPRVGLVGYGYWGPNLLRNLTFNGGCEVIGVADASDLARAKVKATFPHLGTYSRLDELLKAGVDAVVIATPPATHKDLAVECLKAGAHILVEKPMAMSTTECDAILEAAEASGRIVMVDHTFVYNPAVQLLQSRIESGELGDLLYYDSVRVNLGGFQPKINVLWDLAPHDLSMLDLFTGGRMPVSVTATGIRHYGADVESLCYLHLAYADQFVAHLHLNWVAPFKVRNVMLGGTKKMAVYDDNQPMEKVKIYDRGVQLKQGVTSNDFRVEYRMGDMSAPAISTREALATLVSTFLKAIETGTPSVTDGNSGRRVVQILEAATQSLAEGGRPIAIDPSSTSRKRLTAVA